MLKSLFNKVAGLRARYFIKKRLRHVCFLAKFMTFLRTHISKNICERLFLNFLDRKMMLQTQKNHIANQSITLLVKIYFCKNCQISSRFAYIIQMTKTFDCFQPKRMNLWFSVFRGYGRKPVTLNRLTDVAVNRQIFKIFPYLSFFHLPHLL